MFKSYQVMLSVFTVTISFHTNIFPLPKYPTSPLFVPTCALFVHTYAFSSAYRLFPLKNVSFLVPRVPFTFLYLSFLINLFVFIGALCFQDMPFSPPTRTHLCPFCSHMCLFRSYMCPFLFTYVPFLFSCVSFCSH